MAGENGPEAVENETNMMPKAKKKKKSRAKKADGQDEGALDL